MGDPRHIPGLSYNVGTCQASGVRAMLVVSRSRVLIMPLVRTSSRWLPMSVCD